MTNRGDGGRYDPSAVLAKGDPRTYCFDLFQRLFWPDHANMPFGATLLKEHFTADSYQGTCVYKGKVYRIIVKPEPEEKSIPENHHKEEGAYKHTHEHGHPATP